MASLPPRARTEKFSLVGLNRHELRGVEDTGREIGRGSFATVYELKCRGLKCVGKKLHKILLQSEDYSSILHRFDLECQLLSELRHPNIVQFLGTYLDAETKIPVLVMEHLPITLVECIAQYGVLMTPMANSILHDVALGLYYLHDNKPMVIHRDLTASNVLLTSDMRAKISDLGVAKILELSPAESFRCTMTTNPGTPAYMPPEVCDTEQSYTEKIDIFSFGVLILHVFSGEWPIPGSPTQPCPSNPDMLLGKTEVERRSVFFEKMGGKHPLRELAERCLSNLPERRPQASELFTAVELVSAEQLARQSSTPQSESRLDSIRESQKVFGPLNKCDQHVDVLKKDCLQDLERMEEELNRLCQKTKAYPEATVPLHNDENWKIDLPLLSALGQNKDHSLEGHQKEGVEEEEEEESGSIQERVVSLNSELAQVCSRLQHQVDVCMGTLSELKTVQMGVLASLEQQEVELVTVRDNCDKYRTAIVRERKLRDGLRWSLEATTEEMKKRIELFQEREAEVAQAHKELRESYADLKHEFEREISRIAEGRRTTLQQVLDERRSKLSEDAFEQFQGEIERERKEKEKLLADKVVLEQRWRTFVTEQQSQLDNFVMVEDSLQT